MIPLLSLGILFDEGGPLGLFSQESLGNSFRFVAIGSATLTRDT